MIENIIGWLAGFIVAFISATGYLGVALLMAIESACIPLPSEIIMTFAGYLVATGQLNLWLVATAGAIGCNIGSVIAYEAGKRGGRPIVERWGRYILIDKHDLDRADVFFAKHGSVAVLIGRLLPVIRTFIAFPAGVARMPLGKFHFYTFIGSWPWCFMLAWVGMKLGSAWDTDPRVKAAFHDAHLIIVAVILVAGVWFVWHKLRKR
ncbi:DedA family protein [Sphingomonas paeninsulae]|jgi:membrane protein DedA with SNARE-associated domain|uniref:DedA family protein n=1 Tax=Sphingomonas paeninsulae TaxID=2319844 RepID=A0A494TLP7_SPHPE|nr:DedA family protein [Sphingomonas paeninsulae]AYJ86741.1 DedA family protein [Sphingomonas paeninsulae]